MSSWHKIGARFPFNLEVYKKEKNVDEVCGSSTVDPHLFGPRITWGEARNGLHPDISACGVAGGQWEVRMGTLVWGTGGCEFLRGAVLSDIFIAGGRFDKMLPRTDEKTSAKN